MHVDGEHRFAAPRPVVFDLITDPEVIRAVLPGCESFDPTGEGTYHVVLKLNLIAFSASVNGDVEFSAVLPPDSYHVRVTGSGSLGSLTVNLEMVLSEAEGATVARYNVEIEATGVLGAMGPVVIQPAAGTIIGQFMGSLEKEVAQRTGSAG